MTSYFSQPAGASASNGEVGSPSSPSGTTGGRPTALSNRLTSVLSASYTDSDIRAALGQLDERGIRNTAETRRTLRLDIQKEVIDSNGKIIQDFGKVADVSSSPSPPPFLEPIAMLQKLKIAFFSLRMYSNFRASAQPFQTLTRYATTCASI